MVPTVVLAFASSGCAAQSRDAQALSPEQLASSINGSRILVNQHIEPLLWSLGQRVERTCSEGQGTTSSRAHVIAFVNQRNPDSLVFKSVPAEFVCSVNGHPAWGMSVNVERPQFVTNGSWGTNYSGTYANYESSEQVAARRGERDTAAQDLQEGKLQCTSDLVVKEEIAIAPLRVGSPTPLGTVIDIKGPLALVQYGEAQRRIRGRDQEWVALRILITQMNC
jgi:hypothetical protein